jgi:hypothetical protein
MQITADAIYILCSLSTAIPLHLVYGEVSLDVFIRLYMFIRHESLTLVLVETTSKKRLNHWGALFIKLYSWYFNIATSVYYFASFCYRFLTRVFPEISYSLNHYLRADTDRSSLCPLFNLFCILLCWGHFNIRLVRSEIGTKSDRGPSGFWPPSEWSPRSKSASEYGPLWGSLFASGFGLPFPRIFYHCNAGFPIEAGTRRFSQSMS